MIWRQAGEDVGDPLLTDEPPKEATTWVSWIDTTTMLADGLTKRMKSAQIDLLMSVGRLNLSFEKVRTTRSDAKEKLRSVNSVDEAT